jgi:hypothetical protein
VAIVREAQWTASSPSGSAATLIITVTATVPVNDHVLVMGGLGSAGQTLTVTDSKGNTYTTHKSWSRVTTPGHSIAMASCKVGTELVNGDTITLTWSTAAGARTGVAARFSGGRQAGWFDAVTAGGGASAATGTETIAGVTVQEANELLVAMAVIDGTGSFSSVTAGWTNETGVASGTTVRTLDWASKIRADGAGTEPDLTVGHASLTSTHFMAAFREEGAAGGGSSGAAQSIPLLLS